MGRVVRRRLVLGQAAVPLVLSGPARLVPGSGTRYDPLPTASGSTTQYFRPLVAGSELSLVEKM
jgi:hypothetical protein